MDDFLFRARERHRAIVRRALISWRRDQQNTYIYLCVIVLPIRISHIAFESQSNKIRSQSLYSSSHWWTRISAEKWQSPNNNGHSNSTSNSKNKGKNNTQKIYHNNGISLFPCKKWRFWTWSRGWLILANERRKKMNQNTDCRCFFPSISYTYTKIQCNKKAVLWKNLRH